MKTKYTMFRRGGVFYVQDSATGKQTSLRTKDETEAKSLLNARNEAQRQPVLNLHLARAYVREERHVQRDGDENQILLVSIYLGNPQENPPLPNVAYKQLLIKGAEQWNLPADYIDKLKQIETEEAAA